MLNIQELANFITEKLNIISADNGASYVFDIYAEIGHNENDGHIKGTIISKSNNPLVVKSLASAKIIYVVELAIPNGMANKKLIEIQNIIGEFVKTYEGTEQDFETGKASFELTYAHLPENYSIKNETGGIVPLQFEVTVNYTDNGLLGSSKVWLLNGAEIPYMNEVILLNKEGQTNRISREKYNKTIVLAQTKFYKFTIPFDTTNTVCTTLQADMLNGDFDKTYTLSYYDGTTYTAQNPFTTTVSIYQSGDSKSDGGAISMFDITFADVSAVEVAPKYTLELFSTPFDEQNERWFDSVEEQTEWYNNLDVKTPAVQIKAPNLNTISNTTQVYDFNGIANFPYTETEVVNMNVARIGEYIAPYTETHYYSFNVNEDTTPETYEILEYPTSAGGQGEVVTNATKTGTYTYTFTLEGERFEARGDEYGNYEIYKDDEFVTDFILYGTFSTIFSITFNYGDNYRYYYYTIQSAEIGANKQVILTLRLNTFQTYVINPQLQFSECFINKAHLNRFVDNGDNTVSFNGGVESSLFEREDTQNVSQRIVNRQLLRYKMTDNDASNWIQNNILGWLYAYFPTNKTFRLYSIANTAVYSDAQPSPDDLRYTIKYEEDVNSAQIDGQFIVLCCPIYKTNKKIIMRANMQHLNASAQPDYLVDTKLGIDDDEFMWAIKNTLADTYALRFSFRPPYNIANSSLSNFEVNSNGDLICSNVLNNTDAYKMTVGNIPFSAVCFSPDLITIGEESMKAGCLYCTYTNINFDMEDYNSMMPLTFPKVSTSIIYKTFFKLKYKISTGITYTIPRPNGNIKNFKISLTYNTISSQNTGTYLINNEIGNNNIEGGLYSLNIKEADMKFTINSLPNDFVSWVEIKFDLIVNGIIGADKNSVFNPKLLNSDYRTLKLTNSSGEEFDYDIQKVNKETIETRVTAPVTPDLSRLYFRIKGLNGVYSSFNEKDLTGVVSCEDNSMPLSTSVTAQTLANQPNYYNQRILGLATGAGYGAIGGALSGIKKGGGVGALVGAGVGLVGGILNQYFADDNMRRQANQIQNASGNVIFNVACTGPGCYIEEYSLLPQEERIINDQMFANGYTYNRIDQLRNFTHTRKYFNTLVANIETMSGLPLSNEVREDIKQRFANGVRLWHDDTIQYEKENYELWLEEE